MRTKLMLWVLAVCALNGCVMDGMHVPSISKLDQNALASKCLVRRDEFKKATIISTPDVPFENQLPNSKGLFGTKQSFQIQAQRFDADNQVRFFLTITTQRANGYTWAFWNDAFDSSGRQFKLKSERADVLTSYMVSEVVSAGFDRAYANSITNGTVWKLYGKNAEYLMTIEKKVIAGLLQRCDETFK